MTERSQANEPRRIVSRHNKVSVDASSSLFPRDALELQDTLVQSLFADISHPGVPNIPPMVDASKHSEVRLLFLFCGACRSVVGAVRAYDLTSTRPGKLLLIAGVQRVADRSTRPPTVKRYDMYVGGDEPDVEARRRLHGVPEVRYIETECSVHGLLEMTVHDAQLRAATSWSAIREAEAAGVEPAPRR